MAQQTIDITPVTGDSGQSGGTKINANFTENYAAIAARELISNKATDFGTLNDTFYPTVQAVETRILQALAGLKWKAPCDIATTATITLSGEQTIDGVLSSVSRVLVKNQSTGSQNGIYVSGSGSWTRATDADSSVELEGASVTVQRGTSNANTTWLQTADGITLGSTSLVWAQFGSSVPSADGTTAGIAKLYASTSLGTNVDGAPTQNAAKAYIDARIVTTITSGDTTHVTNSDALFTALALKTDESDFSALTDGATVNWNQTSVQNPESKLTTTQTALTLAWTNVKSGANGILKLIVNQTAALVVTFPSGFTSKSQNTTFTTYTFPAGPLLREYFLSFAVDGTVIEWVIPINGIQFNRQASSYTLVLGDAYKTVEMNNASANNLTVPLNSSVAFDIGTEILISQYGAGQTTVVATGGVTIRSKDGALKIVSQYSAACLVKVGADEWYLWGDITA